MLTEVVEGDSGGAEVSDFPRQDAAPLVDSGLVRVLLLPPCLPLRSPELDEIASFRDTQRRV